MKLFPHEVDTLSRGSFLIRDDAFAPSVNAFANAYVRDVGGLRQARVGGANAKVFQVARSDEIRWLTEEFDSDLSNPLFEEIKSLRSALACNLDREFTKVSVQLARYSGEGSHYVRHSDVSTLHTGDSAENEGERRLLTVIYYLNPGWKEEDGGKLRMYARSMKAEMFDVDPLNNRIVIFPSEIEHEVLPIHRKPRWALTFWLYGPRGTSDDSRMSLRQFKSTQSLPTSSIFVSIACFRDEDIVNTINDLFEKSSSPENIRVGVCWQGDEAPHFNLIKDRNKVRWTLLTSDEAEGPMNARNIILTELYSGERYILQIDAHTRFADDWDLILVSQLALCPTHKSILTAYPPGFTLGMNNEYMLTDLALRSPWPVLCADRFDENGFLRTVGRQPTSLSDLPSPSLFWAAGFSFSDATAFFEEGRPNVKYLFFGEETLMAAFFYLNGWRFYTPGGSCVIFHLWSSRTQRPQTSLVVPGEKRLRATSEFKRLLAKMREYSASDNSWESFEKDIGIKFDTRSIGDRAQLGGRASWAEFNIEVPLPRNALSLIYGFLH